MIKSLENKLEKMQKSINKVLGELKNKHRETNNTIIVIKNTLLLLLSHFSHVQLCVNPQTAAHQAPPSLGFSRQDSGVGCHFLLQCMKVKSESEVAQSCPTSSNPMDCSLPGSQKESIAEQLKKKNESVSLKIKWYK